MQISTTPSSQAEKGEYLVIYKKILIEHHSFFCYDKKKGEPRGS